MDVRIDEAGRDPAATAVNDVLEVAALLPREYVRCRTDIRNSIAIDDDRGIANHRVGGIDGQGEFQVLDKNAHL